MKKFLFLCTFFFSAVTFASANQDNLPKDLDELEKYIEAFDKDTPAIVVSVDWLADEEYSDLIYHDSSALTAAGIDHRLYKLYEDAVGSRVIFELVANSKTSGAELIKFLRSFQDFEDGELYTNLRVRYFQFEDFYAEYKSQSPYWKYFLSSFEVLLCTHANRHLLSCSQHNRSLCLECVREGKVTFDPDLCQFCSAIFEIIKNSIHLFSENLI